ncbi:hypothetical protein ACFE04_001580 [Oxalis oulophora]
MSKDLKIDIDNINYWQSYELDHDQLTPYDITGMQFPSPMNSPFSDQRTSSMPFGTNGYGSGPRFQNSSSFNCSLPPATTPTSNQPKYHSDVDKVSRNEKKKAADRNYRNRQREGKQKLIEDLGKYEEENLRLTIENGRVKKQRDEMNEDLQLAKVETKKLKTEVCKLKGTIKVQETIVATYSHRLINDNHAEEVEGLKRKLDVMSKKIEWEEWMTEKEEFLKKIATLENENKISKVQIEALCLKISNTTAIDSEES